MSLEVRVEIIGALLRPQGKRELALSVPADTTVAGLLERLGYQPTHIPHIVAAIDGKVVHPNAPLKDGAEVLLSTLVGGG